MVAIFLLSTFMLFIGLIMILALFQDERLEEGVWHFVIGALLIIASAVIFKQVVDQIDEREKMLLSVIIDNNLTNKKIEKEFKEEIFEIEKEKAVKKIKKELKIKHS